MEARASTRAARTAGRARHARSHAWSWSVACSHGEVRATLMTPRSTQITAGSRHAVRVGRCRDRRNVRSCCRAGGSRSPEPSARTRPRRPPRRRTTQPLDGAALSHQRGGDDGGRPAEQRARETVRPRQSAAAEPGRQQLDEDRRQTERADIAPNMSMRAVLDGFVGNDTRRFWPSWCRPVWKPGAIGLGPPTECCPARE